MSKILTILLAIIFAAVGVFAQSENNLKQQSEGKRVTRKYIVSSSHRHVTVERCFAQDSGRFHQGRCHGSRRRRRPG